MTKTSSFGTSKRESHDATEFYARSLLKYFEQPDNEVEPNEVTIGSWADQIYCTSAVDMAEIPDNHVGLAFTSPPYNVGKDYDDDLEYNEYIELIKNVAAEVHRVLVPGGRYVINVANLGRKPYIPLHSSFHELHRDVGFYTMGEIIWRKGKGASSSCAWGSWLNAKAPRLRDVHEYLLVFAKDSFSRPDKGISTIERDEFLAATLSIWEIQPESAKRVGHPAPFPVDLASRVIELYSYLGDVVLDPFVGSGTTCVAAKKFGRHFVGYDISQAYCDLSLERLEDIQLEPRIRELLEEMNEAPISINGSE